MSNLEIVEQYLHKNGNSEPFIVAIVDDPDHNDTKLVIMFQEYDYTAVFSLDTLIESEDVTPRNNGYAADYYEKNLRKELWGIEDYEETELEEDYLDDEEYE